MLPVMIGFEGGCRLVGKERLIPGSSMSKSNKSREKKLARIHQKTLPVNQVSSRSQPKTLVEQMVEAFPLKEDRRKVFRKFFKKDAGDA